METHHDPAGGLTELLGATIEEASSDRCVLTLDIDGRHHQPYGIVHGGTYCVLVETAASLGAAMYAVDHGMAGAVGLNNSTDFFRSHRTGQIQAIAEPIHQGRTQQVWAVEIIRDEDGKLLARGQVRLHNLHDPVVIGERSEEETGPEHG
jgi:uncharacterized protein (TIGR00369 family)